MKTCVVVLFIVLASGFCFAQPPDTLWTRTLGGTIEGSQEAWGVASANDGSTWVAGFQQLVSLPPIAVIYKLSLMGAILDTFRYADENGHAFFSAAPTSDGGCIAAGKTVMASTGDVELLLIKLNANGAADWTQTYSDDNTRVGFAVQQTADGGYVAAGRSRDASGMMRAFLVKTDAAGAMQWSHNYGTTSNDQAYAVQQTPDGGYVLTGTTDALIQNANAVLAIRTNTSGGVVWRQAYRPGDYDEGHAIRLAMDGGYVIAGWTRVTDTYNNDMLLLEVDASGVARWNHHYGIAAIDIGWSAAMTQDGGFVIAGYTRNSTNSDAMLLKTSSAGDSMWSRIFQGQRDGEFKAVAVSSDGGILAVGYRYINGNSSNYYAVRLAVPSGVGGIIRDERGSPVEGARVAAVGQPYWAMSNALGQYTLALLPGTYDLHTYGPCTGRDTVRNITVLGDSIVTRDLTVGRTHGIVEQTSLNPVVHNHIPWPDTLHLRNSGAGIVDFSVICHPLLPPTAWLSAVPAAGSMAPGDSLGVLVWVHADTNNAGIYDYSGLLDVHMNSCPDSLWHVPVVASVLDADPHFILHPSAFSLSASPNPFNPTTTIRFDLPRAENVSLVVYDVTGREVETLLKESLSAGPHRMTFDGGNLSSGLYFARLSTSHEALTYKLLLIR